jgi:uncharacterized membrane protein YfcA
MIDGMLLFVLAVIFFATLIRSAFGFGEALVAVPLLALVMPVEVAAPVAVLVSITVAAIVVVQDWRHVHFRSAAWLVLATVLGTPLGLLMLTTIAERTVKMTLAGIIIAFSSYSLLKRHHSAVLTNDRWAWVFGLGAGILGGAYGMNGPPLVIYGTLRGWTPQHFRATLQGYFLPASLVGLGGYWFAGLLTPTVARYYGLSLPVVIVAIILGRVLNRQMTGRSFLLYIHLGLIAVGALLLLQSIS